MRKTIAAIAMMLALMAVMLMASCDNEPRQIPEDQLPCYVSVDNLTGHDIGWSLRRAGEPSTGKVSYSHGIPGARMDKHSLYVLDIWIVGNTEYRIEDGKLKEERRIIDSVSFDIDTDTYFQHSMTLRYDTAEGYSYNWVRH